jgi:catechol 2,3-dioxygenase-like lactoylglutathione lyase family enzyme
MFDHVTIRTADRESSESFYELLLQGLGVERAHTDDSFVEWSNDFSLRGAAPDEPVTRRLHIAFAAPSRAEVDEFWHAGTRAGYRDDGAPGERPQYSPDYYGAFLLDPDGNSVEAVHYSLVRAPGEIDHLWMRVADLGAAKRFYAAISPHAGLRVGADTPRRAQFRGSSGSFSLVPGAPTEHLHMALPAGDDAGVDAFHRAATAAGYRDNGPPGERPEYHPGYYAAFVLDPDGNNVEVVNHNRRGLGQQND